MPVRLVHALHGPFAGRWDLLELPFLDASATATERLAGSFPSGRLTRDSAISRQALFPDGFERYRDGLRKDLLRDIERDRRRLGERHGEVRVFSTRDLAGGRLEQFARLYENRQRALRRRGVERAPLFEQPASAAAFRALMDWGAREGLARHWWLEAGGEVVSAWLCHVDAGILFNYFMGHEERFNTFSPSRILYFELIEREVREFGTRMVEFGRGDTLLKRQFATHATPLHGYRVGNRARMLARLRVAWLGAGRLYRRVTHRLRRRQRILDSPAGAGSLPGTHARQADGFDPDPGARSGGVPCAGGARGYRLRVAAGEAGGRRRSSAQ